MDFVSQVNLYCQKNGKPLPNYAFIRNGEQEWIAKIMWDGFVHESIVCANKKLAKQEAAKYLFRTIKNSESYHISPVSKTVLMIDGDQRHDVVKWLESSDVTWENLVIRVYTSPNSSLKCSEKIPVKVSKTTNRDSADALLLIDLGRRLYRYPDQRIIIVSSDHILIQAAQDNDLEWAKDLSSLKELLSSQGHCLQT